MTIVEFDAWTAKADEQFTYELHDGTVYAFATGTEEHGLLSMRIAAWLLPLVEPPCRVHQGTIAVRRRPDRPSSVVPDVLFTCEPRERGRSYVSSPKLVVEVISPTSATNDMYRKPRVYDAVESLSEYLVVDSRSIWARLFRRDDDGKLSPVGEDLASPDSRVSLATVALSFTLAELYEAII